MDLLTTLINSYLHEPHASLMNGILLGRPLFVTDTFYNQLKIVGLIHIVVLSGMNISMLSAIILHTLAPLLGRKVAMFITITVICGFVWFVGFDAPIVRAGIMGILSLVGLIFGRKTLAMYTLFVSALIMILVHPPWLGSVSFQLSFAATLGIILFGNVQEDESKIVKHPPAGGHDDVDNTYQTSKIKTLTSYLSEELRISLSAQVFTLPIIFWYFRQISFISPVANILVAWLIAPIMILGFITVVIGMINWHLGFYFSWIAYPLLSFIVFVVEALSQIPFASVQF